MSIDEMALTEKVVQFLEEFKEILTKYDAQLPVGAIDSALLSYMSTRLEMRIGREKAKYVFDNVFNASDDIEKNALSKRH